MYLAMIAYPNKTHAKVQVELKKTVAYTLYELIQN